MKRIYERDLPNWYGDLLTAFIIVTAMFLVFGVLLVGGGTCVDREIDFDKRCYQAGMAGIEVDSSYGPCVRNYNHGRHLHNLVNSENAEMRLESFVLLFPQSQESDSVFLSSFREQLRDRNLEPMEISSLCSLDAGLRMNINFFCFNTELISFLVQDEQALQNFDIPDDEEKFYPRIVSWIGLGIYAVFGLIFAFSYFPLNIKNYYGIPHDDVWIFSLLFSPFWLGGMAVIAVFHLPILVFAGGYRRTSAWRAKRRKIREESEKYGKDVVRYLKELNLIEEEIKKEPNKELRASLLQTVADARKDIETVKSKRVKRLSVIKEEVKDKSNLVERAQIAKDKAAAMLDAEDI